jgi:hypothetical protein
MFPDRPLFVFDHVSKLALEGNGRDHPAFVGAQAGVALLIGVAVGI